MDELVKKYVIERYKDKKRLQGYIDKTLQGLTKEENVILSRYLKNKTVLDVGCGTGREALAFSKAGFNVTAIDISKDMINSAKKIAKKTNILFEECNILDYSGRKFDNVIFFNNIFEQIPAPKDRMKALKTAYQSLNDNGIFVLTTHSIFVPGKYGRDWIQLFARIIKFYIKKVFRMKLEETSPSDLIIKEDKIYAHFSNPLAIKKLLIDTGFTIIYVGSGNSLLSGKRAKAGYLFHEPVYYICTK